MTGTENMVDVFLVKKSQCVLQCACLFSSLCGRKAVCVCFFVFFSCNSNSTKHVREKTQASLLHLLIHSPSVRTLFLSLNWISRKLEETRWIWSLSSEYCIKTRFVLVFSKNVFFFQDSGFFIYRV